MEIKDRARLQAQRKVHVRAHANGVASHLHVQEMLLNYGKLRS